MDDEIQLEIDRIYRTVDEFATEMKARLREQALKGYRGWDDPTHYRDIMDMMLRHASVSPGQEVDAANLAMILWYLRRSEEM